MNKESKLNLNASDYAISHCDSDKTYKGTEVHKMLCDAYIAGNNDTLDDKDEEIRKALINVFAMHKDYEVFFGVSVEDICAWLEKQGKHSENYNEAEREKADFVGDGFIQCYADFLDFKEGNTYRLEYIGDDKYNVRSDNLLGKTYHITPCQLYTVFKKLTWLKKQGEKMKAKSEVIKDYIGEENVWNNAHDFRPRHMQRCLCYDKYMGGVYCYVYDNISKYWCPQTTEKHDPNGDNHICDYADYRVTVWMCLPKTTFYPKKQGKQESIDPDTLIQQRVGVLADIVAEQNSTDELEPKFHEGDWITNGDYTWKIVKVKPLDYILLSQDGNIVDDTISHVDEHFHSFTIQDAKDGDVLAIDWQEDGDSWEKIIIFKKYHSNGVKGLYSMPCVEGYGNTFKNGKLALKKEVPYFSKTWTANLHPAVKEQRELLFSKIKEVGWEWDSDKNELSKAEQNSTKWSEEDERICQCLIRDQEKALDEVRNDKYGHFEIISDLKEMYRERIDWLKSLKDRYIFKPSEEQIIALNNAVLLNEDHYNGAVLSTLLEQLKKL